MPAVAPFLFGISVAAALPFHRARHDVAPAAPVSEARRTLARLLAALPVRGGRCGVRRPGRLARAGHRRPVDRHGARPHDRGPPHHGRAGAAGRPRRWWPSRSAPPSAGGRRGSWPVVPALFVLWFVVSVYWLFGQAAVTPFSVDPGPAGRHPRPGPASADPLSFPSDWLLVGAPHTSAAAGSGSGCRRRSPGGTTCGCSGSPRCCSASRGPGRDDGHCSPSGRSSPWQASSASTW